MKRIGTIGLLLALLVTLAGCGSTPAAAPEVYAQDGLAQGKPGDRMRTYFFAFTVDSASLCDSFGEYLPEEGHTLLTVEIAVDNTVGSEIEMYDTDFLARWGDSEEDFACPITYERETGDELETVRDDQLPGTYSLAADEHRTGVLVYEVPAGSSDFTLDYQEYFDDGSEDGKNGDLFRVSFTAEQTANTAA